MLFLGRWLSISLLQPPLLDEVLRFPVRMLGHGSYRNILQFFHQARLGVWFFALGQRGWKRFLRNLGGLLGS